MNKVKVLIFLSFLLFIVFNCKPKRSETPPTPEEKKELSGVISYILKGAGIEKSDKVSLI